MPELPEVETIKNELIPHIIGHRITGVILFWEGMVRDSSIADFRSRLIGQRITGLGRRGKYLLFHLSSGEILVIHLRMTGSLLLNSASHDGRFIRVIIQFNDGTELSFRDPRKFGVMWLVTDAQAVADKLGPEPLEDTFTPEVLTGLLHNRTAPIKAMLLDQSVIAGIGNMYADEALFAAKIHPMKPAGSLTKDEIERLHGSIIRVLRKGLESKGASIRNYIRPDGRPGTAHDEFSVAHGTGKSCPRCGTPIKRIVVRGRGTYFCPECQAETA